VFNDGIWDQVKDEPAQHQLVLAHGKPLTYAGGTMGVRLGAGLVPELVKVGDDGVREDQLLVHDERGSTAYAHLLAGMTHPAFPVPVGVLHVEDKPTYEAMAHQQVAEAKAKLGEGQIEKLLLSGMTWEVGADGVHTRES
jgi:2-oxoglutarate ferredoxin oxidoreductase subunit beta